MVNCAKPVKSEHSPYLFQTTAKIDFLDFVSGIKTNTKFFKGQMTNSKKVLRKRGSVQVERSQRRTQGLRTVSSNCNWVLVEAFALLPFGCFYDHLATRLGNAGAWPFIELVRRHTLRLTRWSKLCVEFDRQTNSLAVVVRNKKCSVKLTFIQVVACTCNLRNFVAVILWAKIFVDTRFCFAQEQLLF